MKESRYVDLVGGVDIEQAKQGALSSEWGQRCKKADYDTAAEFKEYLMRQGALFDVQRDILEARYVAAKRASVDFTQPNVKEAMVFQQGYMQALLDVYKLLPRP